MAKTNALEKTLGDWYKNVPHLPKNAQKWLADNIWWLALVGAVLSVLGLLVVIPALMAAVAVTSVVSSAYGMPYSGAIGGLSWLSLVLSLVGYVVTTVLLALSVNPLKVKSKKGWNLLFYSFLVNFTLNVISAFVIYSVYNVIMAVVSAGVGGYFLFEIHGYFGAHHKAEHKKV